MMIFLKYFNLTEMKKFISAALVVAMAAASCTSKEDLGNNNAPQQPAGDGTMTFSADFAEPIAKATPNYDESARSVTVLWQANDKVGVYATDGAPAEFTASVAGERTALTGRTQPDAETYYAMYPYDENATLTEGEIATSLPAAQTATKDAFAAHLAVASTTGSSFSFQNVCGLVRVYVGCEHVTEIKFKGNSEEIVAGDIVVDAATAKFSLGTTQEKEITVTPPAGAETFETGAYYFSVLPQEFSQGFTVTYETSDGFKELRQASNVTIPRSSLVVGKAFTDIQGAGTEADPFVIKTVHDLCNLSEALSTENPNYVKLANDIDMAEVETWTPINNDRRPEYVREIHFDGKNHTISNFAPTSVNVCEETTDKTNASLFGIIVGTCENLIVENAQLNLPNTSTTAIVASYAGFIGVGDGEGEPVKTIFRNVHVTGTNSYVTANKVVGGLVGSTYNAKFEQCSSSASVTGSQYHNGGLVGRCDGGENIFEECFATGSVNCTMSKGRCAGGLIGGDFFDTKNPEEQLDVQVTLTRCYATGNVQCSYQAAALVGCVRGTTIVQNSYATGTVTGVLSQYKHLGGIVGAAYNELSVENCYYVGDIMSAKNEGAGGIVGLSAADSDTEVKQCFAITNINSTSTAVGGIFGVAKSTASIQNCYATGTLTASSKCGAILGESTVNDVSVSNCKYNSTLNAVGSGTVTESSNSSLSQAYANASAVATALGWSDETWDLTGETPTLKCFK